MAEGKHLNIPVAKRKKKMDITLGVNTTHTLLRRSGLGRWRGSEGGISCHVYDKLLDSC